MQKFVVNLSDNGNIPLLKQPDLECFVTDTSLAKLESIVKQVREEDKIILFSGANACEMCCKYDADGVVLDLSKSEHCAKEINFARKQLKDKAIGVISRNRRHEAMIISECEPDFVVFKAWHDGLDKVQELVAWYNEMFLIQSAVILAEEGLAKSKFDCDIVIGLAEDYKEYKE